MVQLETMYKGQAFSPATTLTAIINATATVIPVDEVSVFPPAPNYATIGTDEEGEVVLYSALTENALSGCTRGVKGTAQTWDAGTVIARNWSSADHDALVNNITALNAGKEEGLGGVEDKSAPADNDAAVILDSAADNARKKLTWARIKAALKTYFDTLYAVIDHTHSSLQSGAHTASLPTLTENKTLAMTSDIPDVPAASAAIPTMDGEAAAGISGDYSRADHKHPSDTAKQNKITADGLLKGDGLGGVSAASAGTDYVAPAALNGYLPTSQKGAASGLASLDANIKVAALQAAARIVTVNASKTLGLTDAGTHQRCINTSAITITIPANSTVAFPVETEIEIYRAGAGEVTIAAASGVTIECMESAYGIADQYTAVALKQMAANVWSLLGNVG